MFPIKIDLDTARKLCKTAIAWHVYLSGTRASDFVLRNYTIMGEEKYKELYDKTPQGVQERIRNLLGVEPPLEESFLLLQDLKFKVNGNISIEPIGTRVIGDYSKKSLYLPPMPGMEYYIAKDEYDAQCLLARPIKK